MGYYHSYSSPMELPKSGRWKAHITKQRKIAENTMEISLWLDGPIFAFQAGQYVKITIPHLLMTDPKGNSRDLSVSSSPAQGNLITVAFRISDSVFKQTLIAAPEGTSVDVQGPLGVFTLPDDASSPLVFVAGGIGITPFLSILRYAAEQKLPNTITLLYANSTPEGAAYLPELEELVKKNSRFTLIKKFGALDEEFIRQNTPEPANAHWYIAGPPGMVAAAQVVLMRLRISEENIMTEEFSGYDVKKESAPVEIEKISDTKKPVSVFDVSSLSTDNLQAILQTLNNTALVSTTDLEGTITYANDKFVEMSQYSRKELIGQNHRILKSGFHPQSFYDDMWHKYLLKGRVFRGEIKNKKKDGTFYWVDASIAPIFNKDGKVAGYVGIRFPITELKNTEESLMLFSNVLKQTTQAWGMANMEGIILDANEAFIRLSGYSKNELQTMKYGSLMEAPDRARVEQGVQWAIETKQPFITDSTLLKKDGSKITVALTVNGYFENDVPRYVYAFLTDITAQQQAVEDSKNTNLAMMNILEDARELEDTLQKEQVRLKTIISTMGEGLIVVDKNSSIILMNETAERIFETTTQKSLHVRLFDLFAMLKDGKKVPDEERPVTQAIDTGATVIGLLSDSFQYQLPSGKKLYTAFVVTPLKGSDGAVYGAVIVFRDITEEKKLDQTRETFISIASHQLRTPLTSIRWYTEMLSAGDAGALTAPQKEFVDNVYTGVLRLSETLNMLLSLTRVESGRVETKPVDVDLVPFTQDIIKELSIYSDPKNLIIDVKLENVQSAHVKIDSPMLREVIVNLLFNAIRYTENKTAIVVRVEPKAGYWLYSVADKGIGIAEENKSRIFEKFFRADNAIALVPDGNGLGLTLARDLVELWGGKIWFESELGKGTTFYFTIPFMGMEARTGEESLL